MIKWAEKEIEIALEREKANNSDKHIEYFDYVKMCYESALKAYECLCNDGHSGYSFGVTSQILNKLCAHKPLTPIMDCDDEWGEVTYDADNGSKKYQCNRYSSLFKKVDNNGNVRYTDVDRYYCVTEHLPDIQFTNGTISRVIDEMFPIKFPYYPTKKIKVVCNEKLFDKTHGDFDAIEIKYAEIDRNVVDINRFFREFDGKFVEVSREEFFKDETH